MMVSKNYGPLFGVPTQRPLVYENSHIRALVVVLHIHIYLCIHIHIHIFPTKKPMSIINVVLLSRTLNVAHVQAGWNGK